MNSEEPQPEKHWVEVILNELEALEGTLPDPKFIAQDVTNYPQWVVNVAAEVLKVGMPTVGLREGLKLDARVAGAFMGSQYARLCSLSELFKEPNSEEKRTIERIEAWVEKLPEAQRLEFRERETAINLFFEVLFTGWMERFLLLLKRAFGSAVEESMEDASAFTGAFHTALKQARKTSRETTAFKVYFWMFMHWRYIQTFESIRQLQKFLGVYLTANELGNLKRLEKICERIGLTLRPPGRPKGSKNGDNGTI